MFSVFSQWTEIQPRRQIDTGRIPWEHAGRARPDAETYWGPQGHLSWCIGQGKGFSAVALEVIWQIIETLHKFQLNCYPRISVLFPLKHKITTQDSTNIKHSPAFSRLHAITRSALSASHFWDQWPVYGVLWMANPTECELISVSFQRVSLRQPSDSGPMYWVNYY